MIAVSTAPASTPKMGLENHKSALANSGTSARGSTAPDMASMPNISTAKPSSASPVSFFLGLLTNMYKTMPITANMGVKDVGLRSVMMRLVPSMPVRDSIHAVTVVPTFAPMMTYSACESAITPELTKPTSMTVVAEEDWITAVTHSPSKKPLSGLEVSRPRMVLSLLPARRSSASPIRFMPKRNSASPPSNVSTFCIDICRNSPISGSSVVVEP